MIFDKKRKESAAEQKPQTSSEATSARRLFIAGNWKMNKTYAAAVNLTQEIINKEQLGWSDAVDVCIMPPATALRGVSNVIAFDKTKLMVGAQNVSWAPEGAYTGEISCSMLTDLDCQYCIVGHSERRQILGETNEMVAKKVAALLEASLSPVICCGETLEIRENGTYIDFVCGQIREALAHVSDLKSQEIIFAYEPIWAIGSGKIATPEQAQEMTSAIRETVASILGAPVAQKSRILYGGSVKPGNVSLFTTMDDVDGVLVGGAALKADSFVDLIEEAAKHDR